MGNLPPQYLVFILNKGFLMFFLLNVCSDDKAGGAESIVNKLSGLEVVKKKTVYFSKKSDGCDYDYDYVFFEINPRNPLVVFKLRRIFRKILKDYAGLVIHSHLTWPLYYVAIASLGLDIKLIFTEHSTYNKRRSYRFLRPLERYIYSRYHKIIGISDGASKELINWLGEDFNEKIMTIPNGAKLFSIKSRQNLPCKKKVNLLSVGSLKELKGFETTIKAISLCEDMISAYTIVGSGPDLDKLKSIAHSHGVLHKLVFTGWSDSLEQYYHDADILLIPSYWEGFGLVAVEGMSTGLPVIASNVSGLSEVASIDLSSVILIDNFKSHECWSNSIQKMILKLHDEADEMSAISRRQAEKFTLDNMLLSYHEIYKEMGCE
jgi:glycosyltransferase involved in cell wall biosynthesis